MPTEIKIKADNINSAAEGIIGFLEGTGKGTDVIYFDGLFGLGASAILKEVAKRVKSSSSLSSSEGASMGMAIGLDKIIHIDCSLWQSKRALQKAITEDLELSQQVMAIFDQHDEEDDFNGVEQSARRVIPRVTEAILKDLHNRTFLVVFHNGSNGYIDLRECGILVAGPLRKRVLWTSRGRFQLQGVEEEDSMKLAGLSDVALSVDPSFHDEVAMNDCFRHLLHAEAEEVARYTGIPKPDMSQETVMECILYRALRGNKYDIDWGTHVANYWVCDGIIQAATNGGRLAWEIGDALQRNMNLDWPDDMMEAMCDILLSGKQWRGSDRWVSADHQNIAAIQVPPQVTSFFCTVAGPLTNNNATPVLQAGMFGHSERSSLHVIHLSYCTLSFSYPPFLGCSNLRFLLLDHCKDSDTAVEQGHHHHSHSRHDGGTCFQKLWVLDLSYTDCYWFLSEEMMCLMAELRELNVKGVKNWSISHLHHGSGVGSNNCRLHKLRVTVEPTDINQASPAVAFPDMSSWSILKTIILDGHVELEQIGPNVLPPLIESFSFFSNVATKIKKISFCGCGQFKTLLLRGLLESLKEMDMSGTAVKTLDLSAVQAPGLSQLVLLGCEKLCAILWPREGLKPVLDMLRIDTTHATLAGEETPSKQEATSDGTSVRSASATVLVGGRALTHLDSYISLRDARLFRSLLHVEFNIYLQVEISSASIVTAPGGHKDINQGINSSIGYGEQVRFASLQKAADNLYADSFVAALKANLQDGSENRGSHDAPAIMWMWSCPPIPSVESWAHCYINIQDEMRRKLPQGTTSTEQETGDTALPAFVQGQARTLHLHDSLSITGILRPAHWGWDKLRWCRLERCPNLDGIVFTAPSRSQSGNNIIFWFLRTFWASQLLKARYIWDWSTSSFQPGHCSFEDLVFLHLDYCPRLIHVLPLYTSNASGCRRLETLEIVCCGDLMEVFPLLDSDHEEPTVLPSLRRIHLHELPMLQRICGRRMLTPKLETMKIRGCWSLRSLPAVRRAGSSNTPLPEVDCEREWWNGLEWDGYEANHHPSLYRPSHSQYYKKTMLRASALR